MDEDNDEGGGNAPYTYLFIPAPTMQGVIADRFMDVSILVGHSHESWKELIATYKAMKMDRENIAELERYLEAIHTMFLRARFAASSVHMVKTDTPITYEEMDAVLSHKQREGTLEAFLRQSKLVGH